MPKPYLSLIVLFIFNFSSSLTAQNLFIDVADSMNMDHTFGNGTFGGGVSFCDFNGDGWDDISLTSEYGSLLCFYENIQGTFQKIMTPIVNHIGEGKSIQWVDFDNDGDKDLFVTSYLTPSQLFENDGNFQFTDISQAAGLNFGAMPTFGACWGDYDRDGLVDLYVTNRVLGGYPFSNYLYHNNGDGTFTDVTVAAGVADSSKAPFDAAFFDFNNDNWPDIYIAQDNYRENTLLRNNKNGTFTDISKPSQANVTVDGMCVAVGDYDDNGYLDIYVSNTIEGNKLLQNNGNATFTELADSAGVAMYRVGWGSNFFDSNNNGLLDLYVSGNNPFYDSISNKSDLYLNTGNGDFITNILGFQGDTTMSFSNAIGDFDNDGDSDIAVSNEFPFDFTLWRNEGNTNNWLKIDLEGTISNRDAIGTRIEVLAGGGKQIRYTHCGIGYLAQNSNSTIFGLDSISKVDQIDIIWPNGNSEQLRNLCVNQRVKLIENNLPISPFQNDLEPLSLCASDSVLLDPGIFQSYHWSTGETSQTIYAKEPGFYSVQVFDNNGVCFQAKREVVENAMYLDINQINSNSATVSVSGGAPPFTYLWSDSLAQTNATASDLPSGTYQVLVVDAKGCSSADSIEISPSHSINDLTEIAQIRWIAQGEKSFTLDVNSEKNIHAEFLIHSVDGKILLEKSISLKMGQNHHQFNLKHFSTGIYFFRLIDFKRGYSAQKRFLLR